MPIQQCTMPDGRKGFKWGSSGKCYALKVKAEAQAVAIYASGWTGKMLNSLFQKSLIAAANSTVEKVDLVSALLKVKKPKPRQLKSVPRNLIAASKKKLAGKLTAYFASQKSRIIAQVLAGYKESAKKSLLVHALFKSKTPEELVAQVQLEGWSAIVDEEITPEVEAAFNAAGMSAIESLNIPITSDMTDLVNERASLYAEELSAQLVTDIDDSTREMIRSKVQQAVDEGWSSSELSEALADSRAFDPARAELIADYELGSALEAGNLVGWQASGVVQGKQWLTADDDLVSDECQANADQGVIPLDEEFQSGDDAPLAHPYCRCVIVGAVQEDNSDQ